MHSSISNVRLAGLAVSTGSLTRDFIADGLALGLDRVMLERTAQTIGLRERKVAAPGVTALDLCEDAARRLLDAAGLDASSIDAVIFVTQTPDHSQPNNASLLHGRLGLAQGAAAFDLSLGCSGWVYGLHQAALLCAHGGAARVLLCAGDTLSRLTHPKDRSADPLFGDAGSAALIERTGQGAPWHFELGADGKGANAIIVPQGGARMPADCKPLTEIPDLDGNVRHAANLAMQGGEVFNFSLRQAPPAVAAVMRQAHYAVEATDGLVLHQANRFVITTVGRKCGFPAEKTPSDVVEHYGNQSSASIPCALIHAFAEPLSARPLKLVLCGFGVGWSWGAVAAEFGPLVVAPIQPYPLAR